MPSSSPELTPSEMVPTTMPALPVQPYPSPACQPFYVIPLTVGDSNPRPDSSGWKMPPVRKRGRKSNVPPAQREQNRKLKKQNMERRRRACIADKLSALHNLAISIIGESPKEQPQQRIEITDILNQCVTVFQGLSEVVKSNPDLQASMRRLSSQMQISFGEQQRKRAMVVDQDEPQSKSRLVKKIKECDGENKENFPRPTKFPTSRHASAFLPVSAASTGNLLPRVVFSPSAIRAAPSSPFPGPPQLTPYDTSVISPLRPGLGYYGSGSTWSTPAPRIAGRSSTDSTDFVTPPSAMPDDGEDASCFNLHNRYRQSNPSSTSPTQTVWRPYLD
ncbi:unnamed protein product [Schistocephalus solidus]|uniref:BHLH domain-containing protein n=1 Tax=Schistocephalus solidus TaxID=70667 RepID=A0A183TIU3_SCHSO|nr:unnamed protein product [Schistocephalus solidus]